MVLDINNNFEINADKSFKSLFKVFEPISYALYGIATFCLGPWIEKGILDEAKVKYLIEVTAKNIKQTPQEYFSDENKLLIAKIVEDSIFNLSNKELCDLYASLIASSMDKRKTVKPIYSSILKEMSPSEAKLLQYFFSNRFLFEINIQSNNHLFTNHNLYNWFWESKYFKSVYSHDFEVWADYDNTVMMENKYSYGDDFYQENIESEVQFLLSKGLITTNPNYDCHQFIPSIKKYCLDTDEDVQKLLKDNEDSIQKTIITANHKVYCLTQLGKDIKEILIDGSDILVNDDLS